MEEERITQLLRVPEWKTLLLDLVERNEIDPWNVDIVKLTNLYLEEIRKRREMDLYLPANAVLASSILLWLKSRFLKEARESLEEREEEPPEDIVEPLPEVEEVIVEPPLPKVIPPTRLVKRTVTLDELLEVMEHFMKKGVGKRVRSPPPPIEDFFEGMEEEDVEDYVEEVFGEIRRMADSTGMVLLSRLAPNDPLEFVKILLALLYLANEGRVELFQERVFGDIIIKLS